MTAPAAQAIRHLKATLRLATSTRERASVQALLHQARLQARTWHIVQAFIRKGWSPDACRTMTPYTLGVEVEQMWGGDQTAWTWWLADAASEYRRARATDFNERTAVTVARHDLTQRSRPMHPLSPNVTTSPATPDKAEAAIMRTALSLSASAEIPRDIRSARTRWLTGAGPNEPERAQILTRMQAPGWIVPVVQPGAPPAVRPLWVVTQAGLDALRAGSLT